MPDNADGCGVNIDYPAKYYIDGSFNFIQPFVDAKVPFNCTINIEPHSPVRTGAAALERLIAQGTSASAGLAAEFGAQHVHVVGHSLGGWWTRAALPLLQGDNIGVYSVTSVDTPHHGSSLADLLVQAHNYPLLGFVKPKFFLGLLRTTDLAADDLQTGAAAGLNAQYSDPTNLQFSVNGVTNIAQYYSVAADADVNADGTIESNEWYPYHYGPTDFLNSLIENLRYNFLGNMRRATVSTIPLFGMNIPISPQFRATGSFQKNDLAVTVNGAQFDGFLPIVPDTSYSGAVPLFSIQSQNSRRPCCGAETDCLIRGRPGTGAAMIAKHYRRASWLQRVVAVLLSCVPLSGGVTFQATLNPGACTEVYVPKWKDPGNFPGTLRLA